MNRLKFTYLLALLLITGTAYCQHFNYEYELKKRLTPIIDTTNTKEIAFFLAVETSNVPEHSIRIVEKDKQAFIEVRMPERNLAKEFFSTKQRVDSIKTLVFIKPISNNFKLKIITAFQKVIELHPKIHKPLIYEDADGNVHVSTYDGPCYDFIVKLNDVWSKCEILLDLEQNDFIHSVTQTNLLLINDMKSGTFKESNYEIYK